MKLLYFPIFFLFLPLSFQKIKAVFFCDDFLREIYKVDQSTQVITKIGNGNGGDWQTPHYFPELEADQGDTIRINCYNINGETFGGGCFLINDDCKCYSFDNGMTPYSICYRYPFLDDKRCTLKLNVFNLGKFT